MGAAGYESTQPHRVARSRGCQPEQAQPDIDRNTRKQADDDFHSALPTDLFVETPASSSGGWSWRFIWDFADGAGGEPETYFTRYAELDKSDPAYTDQGNFDQFGSIAAHLDVVRNYISGGEIPTNSSRPPLDDRGGEGLDVTEYLDGMICRGHVPTAAVVEFAEDIMDIRTYNLGGVPMTCP